MTIQIHSSKVKTKIDANLALSETTKAIDASINYLRIPRVSKPKTDPIQGTLIHFFYDWNDFDPSGDSVKKFGESFYAEIYKNLGIEGAPVDVEFLKSPIKSGGGSEFHFNIWNAADHSAGCELNISTITGVITVVFNE